MEINSKVYILTYFNDIGGEEDMVNNLERRLNDLLDYYIVILLFLAFFILTFIGAGSVLIVGMIGVLLCLVGLLQESVKVDIWAFASLAGYNLISMASSYVTYGNTVDGYVAIQGIFPVIYLLMATLTDDKKVLLQRLCVTWTAMAAAISIFQFVYGVVVGKGAGRLGGIMGNPNALGIFLVVGWFALLSLRTELTDKRSKGREKRERIWNLVLCYAEPILLVGLAMTLSMGSFCAMAWGIVLLIVHKKEQASLRETLVYVSEILAKASFCFGVGILIYIGANKTNPPWVCILLLIYVVAVTGCWTRWELFLNTYRKMTGTIAGFGVLVAGLAIAVRPSAVATFTERIAMMENGLQYITAKPLLGVGPYQWRLLNLYDSDTYFNTYHIHNVFIHVGVELGMIAMALLFAVVVRYYIKRPPIEQRAEFTAFLIHNLMDTSLFYVGITALTMMTVGRPREDGRQLNRVVQRVFFGMCTIMFTYHIYYSISL
ncbi:MAG: O-antigen ligase family protein [Firmicutes bacterium]|nr:O-antigen ligase family protein [Bacillota bacterium]